MVDSACVVEKRQQLSAVTPDTVPLFDHLHIGCPDDYYCQTHSVYTNTKRAYGNQLISCILTT